MAFCSACGTEVGEGVRFCPKCGKAVGESGAAPPPPSPSGAPFSRNGAAALTYLLGLVSGIIFLVWEAYNKDRLIRFHAFQSIFFNIALIVLSTAAGFVPFVGWILTPFLWLGGFLLWLVLMFKAYQGAMFKVPILGDFAEKQAGPAGGAPGA